MQNFIINILRINIFAAVCIFITVVIARFLGRRYSARWKCAIWLLLSVVLLFPVNLTGRTALVQMEVPLPKPQNTGLFDRGNKTSAADNAAVQSSDQPSLYPPADSQQLGAAANSQQLASPEGSQQLASSEGSQQLTPSEGSQQLTSPVSGSAWTPDIFQIITVIWLSTALLLFLFRMFTYFAALKKLKRWSSPMRDEITLDLYRSRCRLLDISKKPRLLENSSLSTPLLAGFTDTCLYLPKEDYSPQELDFIFRHELCHYRRRDLWFKGLLFLVRSLYWFNPALSFMQREAEKDLEFTCDEHVIREFPQTSRLRYNELLLRTAAHSDKNLSRLTAGLNDSVSGFKERVHNVMEAGRRKKGRIPALFLILFFLSSVLFIGCSLKPDDTSSQTSSATEQTRQEDAFDSSYGSTKKDSTVSRDEPAEKKENLSETKSEPVKIPLKTEVPQDQEPKNTEPENAEIKTEPTPEEFVIFDSNTKVLTQQDTANLSEEELMYARNEIYARHGYIFTDPAIKGYFESKSWYKPQYTQDQFSDSLFNSTEVQNIQFLLSQENAQDGPAVYQGDGYSFQYPAEWQDKLVFEPTEVGVAGILKEQYELRQSGQSERFGNIFTIFKREQPDDNPDFQYLGQGPDGMYYYFYIAQGVTHEETPEMNDAYSRLDFSWERAQIIPNTFTFN